MRSLLSLIAASLLLAPAARAQETPTSPPTSSPKAAAVTPKTAIAATGSDLIAAPATPASTDAFGGRRDGGRVWGSVEYLLWWTKGQFAPPLVTTSDFGDINGDPALAGVLGLDSTTILYGNRPLNNGLRSGGRATIGYWVDDCRKCGIGASFFMLEDSIDRYEIASTGTPIVARPFFDVLNNQQAAEITAFPDLAAGCITITAFSQFLGADAFVRKQIRCGCDSRVDALVGYRFLLLRDSLQINELVVATTDNGGLDPGTAFTITDRFQTSNQFHGVDLGLLYQTRSGRWSADLMGRVALGATTHWTTISGTTAIERPDGAGPVIFDSGFLALETNSGVYRSGSFSVVPEIRVSLGYDLCDNVRAFVGYNFLYWTNVVRAAEQIDLNLNSDLFPPSLGTPPAQPVFPDRRNDFWAQGLNFGLSVNY